MMNNNEVPLKAGTLAAVAVNRINISRETLAASKTVPAGISQCPLNQRNANDAARFLSSSNFI